MTRPPRKTPLLCGHDAWPSLQKHWAKGLCRPCYKLTRIEKDRAIDNRRSARLREQVLRAYEPQCKCCGESTIDFLTIDHINGNGRTHRKLLNTKGGQLFYKWVIANNFPTDLQVLCMNCNWGKRLTGVCPHKRNEER